LGPTSGTSETETENHQLFLLSIQGVTAQIRLVVLEIQKTLEMEMIKIQMAVMVKIQVILGITGTQYPRSGGNVFLIDVDKYLLATTLSYHRKLQLHTYCTQWPVLITQQKKVNHSSAKKGNPLLNVQLHRLKGK
jgi:hypothetical protein